MHSVKAKRIRSPNFTEREKRLLLKLIYDRRTILESRDTNSIAYQQKKQAWMEITAQFNKLCPAGTIRTATSIRQLYDNLKNKVRRRDKIRQNGSSSNCLKSAIDGAQTEYEDESFLHCETISVESDNSDISTRDDIDFATNEDEDIDTKVIILTNDETDVSRNVKDNELSINMNSLSNSRNFNLVQNIERNHLKVSSNSQVEHFKRQRGPNFSKEEKKFLLKLFAAYSDIIDCKETTIVMNHKKDVVWQGIADQLNQHFKEGPFRSALSVRRLHDNCKRMNKIKTNGKHKIFAKNKITAFDLTQTDFVWRNDDSSEGDSSTGDNTNNEELSHENNEVILTHEKIDVDETSVTDSGICSLRIAEWAKIASNNTQWTNPSSPQQQPAIIYVDSLSAQDDAAAMQEVAAMPESETITVKKTIPTLPIQQASYQRLRNRRRCRPLQLSRKHCKNLQEAKLQLIRLNIASERRKARDDLLRRKALELDIALKELYLEKLRNMSDVKDVPFPPPCILK